ncbi:MAG: DUF1016 family protein [Bacteroidales bacterium]|nr:DUF1016 family protein [Bacteroidales bacterium]
MGEKALIKAKQTLPQSPDADLMQLADKKVAVIEEGKRQLAININRTIKTTYWNVGRHIVEFEQQGNARAKYGTSLLSNLAKILRARVGRGYSRPNLNNMRKFYLIFPICQMSDKSEFSIRQMNMYMGYFAKEENVEGDNPPIGIVMGHYKDELMVEYATYGMDSNLFVSKYELFLPNKEELRKMVANILEK